MGLSHPFCGRRECIDRSKAGDGKYGEREVMEEAGLWELSVPFKAKTCISLVKFKTNFLVDANGSFLKNETYIILIHSVNIKPVAKIELTHHLVSQIILLK